MPSADEIKQRIETGIPGASAEVETSDEVHFSARIVAPAFSGSAACSSTASSMTSSARANWRPIHALSIKTETP